MTTAPRTAMVLAAGLGTRMRPLTDDRPKPLIKVAGKPLIDYALDRFAAAGVRRAVVNVHYFPDMLETHLKARREPAIALSDERGELLETGGGLKRAAPLLGDGAVYCTNTDAILVDGPGTEACARLAQAWTGRGALLLLAPREAASGYEGAGDFDIEPGGALRWRTGESARFVFTGLQILSLDLLDGAPEGPFSMRLLWEKAAREGAFHGVVHDGFWMHVGDPGGLELAERRLAGGDA